MRARPGFTLLEVMVAVAILGLSLTVILSAQVGLFSSGTYGQHISEATGLARCRMTEIEEQFLKFGYPEVDAKDDGACCGSDLRVDMRCEWRVERVELPLPPTDVGLDAGTSGIGSAGLDFGGPQALGSVSNPLGPGGGLGPLSALAGATGALPGGGSVPGGTSGLSGVLAAGASGGTGALAPLVMGFVYPMLKPMLEASIRKVTVIVNWREGLAKRDIEIVQWVTNPQKGGFLAGALGSDSAGGPSTTSTAPVPNFGGLNVPQSIPGRGAVTR